MKRLLPLLLLLPALARAQYVRFDYAATTVIGNGQYIPVYAIPGAAISFYSCSGAASSTCTTLLTTHTSPTGSACPTSTQVVLQQTNTCVASADNQGNFGTWIAPSGQFGYAYTITVQGMIYGPFQFTVGTGNSTSVTSFNTRTGAITLNATDVDNVGAITNNTSGTAASATSLASGHTPFSPVQISIAGGTLGATCSAETSVTIAGLMAPSGATPGSTFTYAAEGNIGAVAGWGSAGGMVFYIYASSANTAKWYFCNQSGGSITYGAVKWDIGGNL